jgi:hypothetical protein
MTKFLFAVCCCLLIGSAGYAQTGSKPPKEEPPRTRPFKVLTSGKKITIQAKKDMVNLIAWTSSGERIQEKKNLNEKQFIFTAPSKENMVFILIEFGGGERHTYKVGLQ